jgi:hypothetical protein
MYVEAALRDITKENWSFSSGFYIISLDLMCLDLLFSKIEKSVLSWAEGSTPTAFSSLFGPVLILQSINSQSIAPFWFWNVESADFYVKIKEVKNMTYQQQLVSVILSHKASAFSVHLSHEDDSTSLRYYPITYDFSFNSKRKSHVTAWQNLQVRTISPRM